MPGANTDPTPPPHPGPAEDPKNEWPDPVVIAKDELRDRILMLGVVIRTGQTTEKTIAFPYADLVWVAGESRRIILSVGNRAEFVIDVKDRKYFAMIIDNLRYGVLEILRDESARPKADQRITVSGHLITGVDEDGTPIIEPI